MYVILFIAPSHKVVLKAAYSLEIFHMNRRERADTHPFLNLHKVMTSFNWSFHIVIEPNRLTDVHVPGLHLWNFGL